MSRCFVALLLGLGLSRSLRATTLESETMAGHTMFSEDLSANGKFGPEEKEQKSTRFNWSGDFTTSRSQSTDPATGGEVTDKTNDFSAGLGLVTPGQFSFDIGYDYSSTPDENLVDSGPSVSIGYTHEFTKTQNRTGKAKKKEDDGDGFTPDLGAKLSFATLNYVQTFTKTTVKGRRKGVLRPVDGTNTIRQNSIAMALLSSPLSFLSVKLSETFYSYNKDVTTFLSFLDSARSLRNSASGLSSTVSGLPERETQLRLTFYFPEDWSLLLQETAAKSVVDQTTAWTTKTLVAKDLGDNWNVGIGYQNESSPTVKDNLIILDARYFF